MNYTSFFQFVKLKNASNPENATCLRVKVERGNMVIAECVTFGSGDRVGSNVVFDWKGVIMACLETWQRT